MSAPGGPAALPKNKKQVLEENLAADRGKETNALLLARLLQGKVTELHDARESARREAHQLRRTPRLNPTVRQSALGLGEMSQSRMLQSEDAWTRSLAIDKQLHEAVQELKDAVVEINRVARRRQLTEKALDLPVQGARYTINLRGNDSKYFVLNEPEIDDQSRIEELMARQVSLADDRW